MSKSGYPTQMPAQSPYPTGSYPAQPPPYTPPGVAQQTYAPPQYMYSQQGLQMVNPPQYANYPQAQSVSVIPHSSLPSYTQATYPQAQYQQGQPQVVYAGNMFDSGARFDGIAQPSVPPPPPGCAPTGAQLMAMQGNTVLGTQQRGNWFTGGSGGGATFW